MTEPQTEPRPAPAAPVAAPRSGVNPAVIVVIAIVVLIALVAGLLFFRGGGGGGAESAATAFFRTTADKGAAASYDAASQAFRDVSTEAGWSSVSGQYRLGQVTGAEWTQRDLGEGLTTVRGVLHRSGLPDLPAAVDLRQVDGTWKVASIALRADPSAAPAPVTADASQASPPALPQAAPGMNQPPPAPGYPGNYTVAAPDGSTVATVTPGVAPPPAAAPGGRAGPAGSMVASGQVGPTCMGQLWKQGVRNVGVDCPLYLPTRPGATEQCTARDASGFTRGVTVTFLDYDPATGQSAIECHPS